MRKESDSIGELEVPDNAYYGVQTLRGYENFHITGNLMNYQFVKNITRIKRAAAQVSCSALLPTRKLPTR